MTLERQVGLLKVERPDLGLLSLFPASQLVAVRLNGLAEAPYQISYWEA